MKLFRTLLFFFSLAVLAVVSTHAQDVVITEISSTDVLCGGAYDGTLTVSITGGRAPYTYLLLNYLLQPVDKAENTNATSHTFLNLQKDSYILLVTDSDTTADIKDGVPVGGPDPIQITYANATDITCSNFNNGVIEVRASGEMGNYIFDLTGAENQTNQTGTFLSLPLGNYTVEVSDADGCPSTDISSVLTIENPDPVVVTVDNVSDANCFGSSTGSISITATGGRPFGLGSGYTYQWTGPDGFTSSLKDITNLAAGSYSVTAFDGNLCTGVAGPIIINQPTQIVAVLDGFGDVQCNGGNDGSATITVSGGAGGYAFSWLGELNGLVSTVEDPIDLLADTYTLTVTDGTGCSSTFPSIVVIDEPLPLTVAFDGVTNVSCFGGSDGSLEITPTGGTPDYTYLWTGTTTGFTSTDEDPVDMPADVYDLTITDSRLCSQPIPSVITITEPLPITITLVGTLDVSCFGGADGGATVTVEGGTPPYLSSWIGINTGHTSSMSNPTDLIADSYNLTVTDSNLCVMPMADLAIINEPTEILVIVDDIIDVACYEDSTGSIDITASGGTPGYTFAWTGPNGFTATTEDLSNLKAGIYNLTITDANACPQVYPGIATVGENTSITATFSLTDITCNAGSDGAISVIAAGGAGDYIYFWQGPFGMTSSNQNISGLFAGAYTLTVTDILGCSQVMPTQTLTEAPPILSVLTGTDITCFGLDNGVISISSSNGVDPYEYSMAGDAGPYQATSTFSPLPPGLHTVWTRDANSCVVSDTITLYEPEEILVLGETLSGENLCYGDASVQISIDLVSGGVPPYTYSIDGGLSFSASSVFSNLPAMSYQTVVRDANGCLGSGQLHVVTEPLELLIGSYSQIDVSTCFNSLEGEIRIAGAGGTPPYNYTLNGTVTNQTGTFQNLPGGTHQITIADANACMVDTSVVILTPAPILVDDITISDVTGCFGDSNGAISVTGSGGGGPITYSINGIDYQAIGNFSPLAAGNYTLYLTDGSCTLDTAVVVSQPDPITLASGIAIPITCEGENDGSIEVTGAGGTDPLTYTLNPGSIANNTGVFTGLTPGNYTVEITDDEGCVGVDTSFTFTDPPLFELNAVNSGDISCYGAADGTIISSVSGGVPPYQYSVDNQISWSSDSIQDELGPGTYEVYIRDANLCTLSGGSFTMTDPAAITATVTITDITTCPGDTSGIIEVEGAGGTGILEYSLDGIDYQSSGIFRSLAAGEYTVFTQDATECLYNSAATVNEPDPLTATITKKDAIFGQLGSIAISESSGGTPPYDYSINGDTGPFTTETIYTDLEAGTYHVIMRDLNACTYEQMVDILDVPPLDVIVNIKDVTCFGENNGSILFVPQNAVGELTYSIDSGMNFVPDPLFENLPGNTTYYLVALDAAGKLFTDMVSILEPSELMISQITSPAQCNAFSETGAIDVTVTGGTGPYTYLWSDGSTEEDRINIGAGNYTLTTTDNNDCSQSASMNISSEVLVFAYAGEDTTICYGESIQLNGQGGYNATWDPSPFLTETDVADPVTLGVTENTTFVLTITEDVSLYACYNKDSVSVSLFSQSDLTVTEDTFIILGTSVQLDAVGGPFVAYRWEPATGLNSTTIPNPIATPPESIRYYVYATNESGCVLVDSVLIEVVEDLRAYNAFSPNGDGINDYFEIEHSDRFPEMQVEIYNRWGGLLYSSIGYGSGKNWDGTHKGKDAPVGTYYYVLIPYSGAKPISGNVTIIR